MTDLEPAVVAGALLPLVVAAIWRPVARGAREAAGTEDHVALLRRNPLFAPLPLTALDRLAESLLPASFEPGEVLMRKGEIGDHYLLIADGEVDVSDDERHLRTCGPGDGIGEIALLHRVPRTATVAKNRVSAYAIDTATFFSAVAGPAGAAAAERVATARLEHSQATG